MDIECVLCGELQDIVQHRVTLPDNLDLLEHIMKIARPIPEKHEKVICFEKYCLFSKKYLNAEKD